MEGCTYTINVKISSKMWYNAFGSLDISVQIQYNPLNDNNMKIVELAKKAYLNQAKDAIVHNIINECFLNEEYSICNCGMPPLNDITTNKSTVYMCYHLNLDICKNNECIRKTIMQN